MVLFTHVKLVEQWNIKFQSSLDLTKSIAS